jgi:hypothetical protein
VEAVVAHLEALIAQSVQRRQGQETSPGAHPASYPMGTGCSAPGVNCQDVKLTIHIHLAPSEGQLYVHPFQLLQLRHLMTMSTVTGTAPDSYHSNEFASVVLNTFCSIRRRDCSANGNIVPRGHALALQHFGRWAGIRANPNELMRFKEESECVLKFREAILNSYRIFSKAIIM